MELGKYFHIGVLANESSPGREPYYRSNGEPLAGGVAREPVVGDPGGSDVWRVALEEGILRLSDTTIKSG